MSTSEREIASLITEIEDGRLEIKPFFQRRLVWTNRDKEYFIETVLKDLPFPEIFMATDKVDTEKRRVKKWLVDGQQRITTLRDYVQGTADLLYRTVKPFADLPAEKQRQVLHYKVSVRDLGMVTVTEIQDIFKRINSTDYSLKKIEILNALYSGEYKRYCIELSEHDFFLRHKVFRKGGDKRMGDVTFCVILVTTMQCGYFRRDEKNEEYLKRYNDEFPDKERTQAEIDRLFDFVDQCGLSKESRAWKQTDLFTLLIELHSAIVTKRLTLDPEEVGKSLGEFYDHVDAVFADPRTKHTDTVPVSKEDVQKYLKAGTKASNDKYSRIDRAEVISKIILATANETTSLKSTEPVEPAKPAKRSRKGVGH